MKIYKKPSKWKHEPWTVVRVEKYGSEGLEDILGFYAYNTRTGERKTTRFTAKEAYKDIPESPNAEPWGV